MSCSIITLPFEIAFIAVSLALDATLQSSVNDTYNDLSQNTNDDNTFFIQENYCIEKKIETAFVDKNILLKTLVEHGLTIDFESENNIKAHIKNFVFNFERNTDIEPYNLKIEAPETNTLESTFNDINNEYNLNIQEKSYLSLINNIKNHNMEIENEEVLEDNTVVLTINI